MEIQKNIVGTVRYLSPEMVTKAHTIDYRADLYSLGMVLYRMLAGKYPEQGSTMEEIFKWHATHESADAKGLVDRKVPQYLIDVTQKLLRPIPTERFSSARVVIKFIELHSGRTYVKSQRELLTTLTEEGPLIGRGDLIENLKTLLHELEQENPFAGVRRQVVILAGSRGVGKTRMLKELNYIAELMQIDTVIVKGSREGRDISHFAEAVGLHGDSARGEVINHLLGRKKTCLMVDDFDDADQSVKDLVVGIAGSLYSAGVAGKRLPILLIITADTRGGEKDLVPIHLGVTREILKPFTPDQTREYLKQFLGGESPPEGQAEDIQKYSGGIPELVKTAVTGLESQASGSTPDTEKFFASQIGMISGKARDVLYSLAVSDRPLTSGDLQKALGFDAGAEINGLITLGLAAFNRRILGYELTAGAIAAAVCNNISKERATVISGRLLDMALSEKRPDVDLITRLARSASRPAGAIDYLLKVEGECSLRWDFKRAYHCGSSALGLMDETDTRMAALRRKLAHHLMLSGRPEEALKYIDAAVGKTSVTMDDLVMKSWIRRMRRRPKEALLFVDQAEDFLPEKSGTEYLKLSNEKALCLLQMGRTSEAEEIFRRNQESASALEREEMLKVVNNNLGAALSMLGRYDEAVDFYNRKFETFSHDKRIAASVLCQRGWIEQQAGRMDDAIKTLCGSLELSSLVDDSHNALVVLDTIINICQAKALFSDALRYAGEAIKLASQTASEKDLASNFTTIGILYINVGLEDLAPRYLDEAASIFQTLNDLRMGLWVQLAYGYMYRSLGRMEEARGCFEDAISRGAKTGDEVLVMWGHCGAAELLMDIGDCGTAATHMGSVHVKLDLAGKFCDKEIRVELTRLKLASLLRSAPAEKIAERFEEVAAAAGQRGYREPASEAYHLLGIHYHRMQDDSTSAKYLSKAREIIEDIARTLSEEYRDSFLRQKDRKCVIEDSIRLEQSISIAGTPKVVSPEVKAPEDQAPVGDETTDLSKGGKKS